MSPGFKAYSRWNFIHVQTSDLRLQGAGLLGLEWVGAPDIGLFRVSLNFRIHTVIAGSKVYGLACGCYLATYYTQALDCLLRHLRRSLD